MSMPITPEQREAITFLLGRIPELIEDEIEGLIVIDNSYWGFRELLKSMAIAAMQFADIHGMDEHRELYEAGKAVRELLKRLRVLAAYCADVVKLQVAPRMRGVLSCIRNRK